MCLLWQGRKPDSCGSSACLIPTSYLPALSTSEDVIAITYWTSLAFFASPTSIPCVTQLLVFRREVVIGVFFGMVVK